MKQKLYEPIRGAVYDALMARARKTNRKRDEIDHKAGFGAPGDNDLASMLRDAITAISCGLNNPHWKDGRAWTCVAEGLDMLQQAEVRARIIPAAARG